MADVGSMQCRVGHVDTALTASRAPPIHVPASGRSSNGPVTIAIRARFEYDSNTIRLQHATRFLCARIRDRFEHSTRISGRRVLHVD